ncbi:MAG: membrane protein insertion efficiency factor YidD [Candidatus Krumholzibacteriota bacterium]|nr:membrane protein insertion efficiency factor YidD [Candidatus Krumholzibacteriota bacterium]
MISRILTKAGLAAVRIYRISISPYHAPVCRFTPSCSAYAEESLKKYGFFKGSGKAVVRLLKCNPFSRGGYDPVR